MSVQAGWLGRCCAWICATPLLFSACTSTPQASREQDTDAKQFASHPNAATIYVYRPELRRDDEESVLYLNNRLIGATLAGTYFRIDVPPGSRLLHGVGRDQGKLQLDGRSGELYFVSLKVENGNSYFELTPSEAARREILRCCALLENWAPGQRPLLR